MLLGGFSFCFHPHFIRISPGNSVIHGSFTAFLYDTGVQRRVLSDYRGKRVSVSFSSELESTLDSQLNLVDVLHRIFLEHGVTLSRVVVGGKNQNFGQLFMTPASRWISGLVLSGVLLGCLWAFRVIQFRCDALHTSSASLVSLANAHWHRALDEKHREVVEHNQVMIRLFLLLDQLPIQEKEIVIRDSQVRVIGTLDKVDRSRLETLLMPLDLDGVSRYDRLDDSHVRWTLEAHILGASQVSRTSSDSKVKSIRFPLPYPRDLSCEAGLLRSLILTQTELVMEVQ